MCMECGALNSIKISKSQHVKKKGAPMCDVNTMVADIGHRQNTFSKFRLLMKLKRYLM